MVKEDCCELSGFTPQAAGGGVEEYEIGEREREKGKELHQSQDDALSMFFFFFLPGNHLTGVDAC